MSMRATALALRCAVAIALAAPACSSPPSSLPPAPFEWTVDVTGLPEALLAVWTDGQEALLVGGSTVRGGLVLEWDAARALWDAPLLPDGARILWWVWAVPGGDAFAVGEGATVLRRAGGLWRTEPLGDVVDPRVTLYGVWGSGPDDVWVVGGSFNPGVVPGVILHFDGAVWTLVRETDDLLFKVWGVGRDDVWAVGEGGTILRWDGLEWRAVPSGTEARLIAVAGRAADEVYAVGGEGAGVVLRWDGVAWGPFADVPEPLAGVWTAPGRALYVGGARGYLARFGRAGDAPLDARLRAEALPSDHVDFHALAGAADLVLAVGADLLGAGSGGWDGTLASHGGRRAGPVEPPPARDAGPPDAPPPPPPDADPPDAAADVPDATPPDAHWPAHGEPCADPATMPPCATGFTCWLILPDDDIICTESCTSAADCGPYGPGACCDRPGPQTLETVCLPAMYCDP